MFCPPYSSAESIMVFYNMRAGKDGAVELLWTAPSFHSFFFQSSTHPSFKQSLHPLIVSLLSVLFAFFRERSASLAWGPTPKRSSPQPRRQLQAPQWGPWPRAGRSAWLRTARPPACPSWPPRRGDSAAPVAYVSARSLGAAEWTPAQSP